MKDYLLERTIKEFDELDFIYSDLFNHWNDVWNERDIHDKLYSCYVRLKIVSLLLRTCIHYKLIDNLNLKTKTKPVSLKDFCDYCIHHSSARYEDNRIQNIELEIYLIINTDLKNEIHFIINKNIQQLRGHIKKLKNKQEKRQNKLNF